MVKQLTETELNSRKTNLEEDMAKIKEALVKIDTEKNNLVAQHHAVSGAIQQVDLFLKDIGVGGDADSSIPSKDKEGS